MSLRQEFVQLAQGDTVNMRVLCRRFGISPKTGYKWRARFAATGEGGLLDRSRRPERSPTQTAVAIEQQVLAVRAAHPTWGPRKLRVLLDDAGVRPLPATSTLSAILHRHGQITAAATQAHQPLQRFAQAAPNQLWQMDFKGHFALQLGRCHPLTVLDDHSRFALGLDACADEQTATVRARLTTIFMRYGLPERMLMDNGSPWGASTLTRWTPLTVWLVRLGVRVSHGRPYHPQTQGKEERFHRTLQEELLARAIMLDLAHAQQAFDTWRATYNHLRPHDALGLVPPVQRYQPSPRPFPLQLPPITYWPGDQLRKVQQAGDVYLHGRRFSINPAFAGQTLAMRPTDVDGVWDLYFCAEKVATLDEHTHPRDT